MSDNGQPKDRGLLDPLEALALIAITDFARLMYPHLCDSCRLVIPAKIRQDLDAERKPGEVAH
jgi:hypothetical protein